MKPLFMQNDLFLRLYCIFLLKSDHILAYCSFLNKYLASI
nr:MAG TPA: hypothetical protein [Bacteriophage sp.]